MSALVANLLDMARLESGGVQLEPAVGAARGDRRQRAAGASAQRSAAARCESTCPTTCRWCPSMPC